MFWGKHKVDGSLGFFTAGQVINGMCENAVEISDEYHAELLQKQSEGLEIHDKDGFPVAEEHIATEEEKAIMVRMFRDNYLKKSDIELLPDNWARKTPEEQQQWADYRQYLRDLPQSENFPNEAVKDFKEWQLSK